MTGLDLRSTTAGEIDATAGTIEAAQSECGMIPWFPGGHCDPWNHVEAAMALAAAGRVRAAERAYRWLAGTQLGNGAFYNYFHSDGSVKDRRLDTNVTAYLATGLWHHYLATADESFLSELWPALERAVEFVLGLQRPGGELIWSLSPSGERERYALLTGSSSAYLSLRCALACADVVGREKPEWELAAGRLRHAVARREENFAPKKRYAMDWYYPVLSGALPDVSGRERLAESWDRFVIEGRGVRCVADKDWVTTAETAECAIACLVVGWREEAAALLSFLRDQRDPSGSYTTGRVYPARSSFPRSERTTYSAAAAVLALDACYEVSPAARLFLGGGLPLGLDLEEQATV